MVGGSERAGGQGRETGSFYTGPFHPELSKHLAA